METLGERNRERTGQTPPPSEVVTPWATGFVEESSAYIRRVCGPHVPGAVVEAAVADVARICRDGPPTAGALGRVRDILRAAALDEAERATRRPGARLGRLARRGRGCVDVPGLLRERAYGRLSTSELVSLYQRLDCCPDCAQLTGRFDGAEWHLQRALVSQRAATAGFDGSFATTGPVGSAAGAVEAPPADFPFTDGLAAAEGLPAPTRPGSPDREAPSPGRLVPPGPSTAIRRQGQVRRSQRMIGRLAAVLILLGVGAAVVSATLNSRASPPGRITPTIREPLPVPLPRSPARAGAPTGVTGSGLVLGSTLAPPDLLSPVAPPESAALARTVVGSRLP